ncbi:MAG: 1-phosphofructokinase [Synechococcales cyanobacterium M58_A2018_015]|nr:1-phosphofructokinase [Synechococcales cyanobacterium M58_A2018_015]
MSPPIVTLTLNPAIDQTVAIPNFQAGAVNRVAWEQADPGGKGVNVASFLSDFGFAVTASGFLGKETAETFQTFFEQKRINNRFVLIPGRTRTNIKIIDEVQNQVTDINFPGQTPLAEHLTLLRRLMEELAVNHDWFILSGSLPTGVPASIYAELTQYLKAQGKTVIVDASGESLRQAIPAAPYAIKPNLDELQEALGRSLSGPAAIVQAARELVQGGITCVVISMGAEGAIFVEADWAIWAHPPQVEVVSTVGAGDAMVAGLVTGKLRGLSLADCAQLATAFSIGALSQVGPRLPPPAEVDAVSKQVRIETLT